MMKEFVGVHEDGFGAEIETEYDTLEEALEAEGYNSADRSTQRSIYRLERLRQSELAADNGV